MTHLFGLIGLRGGVSAPMPLFNATKTISRWPGGASAGRGQADQIGAHLPETYCSGLVVAALRRSLGFAVGEVAARHPLEVGSGRQVD